ncbi:complement component C6 [Clupea harengus]|uniref:Complement component C6 n=1 Tax=Clupea harengus TaxID=7950 RepID=A0A6P3VHU9_CLUHA|nr:complement component C6 [Clupea harengus]
MDHSSWLLCLLCGLSSVTLVSGCHCDNYPWSSWTSCSKTCNYGTQTRQRSIRYDEYYRNNNCNSFCEIHESRACNVEACPINCRLTAYGPWSECSPCVKKQLRARSVETPGQFGGAECTEPLMEERPCHSAKECRIEAVNCKDLFKCDSGRCIEPSLECNTQNDCGDNSDERNCARLNPVCKTKRRYTPIPGAELTGNGFDVMAEEMRGAVLENSFMGADCTLNRSKENRAIYRIAANIESYELKVEYLEDFKKEDSDVQSNSYSVANSFSSGQSSNSGWGFSVIIFGGGSSRHSSRHSTTKTTIEASQKKDSKFFRVHQVLATSTFKMKESDLYLSDPFLKFLHHLPLEYNYPLYREVFQQFGTHYFTAGTLGGLYDILYQYDREELKNSGLKDENVNSCLKKETWGYFLFFGSSSSYSSCGTNKMTEKHEGSFFKSSERSISRVKGGRSAEAAALAWSKDRVAPESTTYTNWLKSTIDNPAVLEYELAPLLNLVRGIPCAVTKRRHMVSALEEYLQDFDSCKCAPCPNNARPVLSGTECLCVCQTGTYGSNCEKRAPDYTSEAVDGRWSCWSAWSPCDVDLKKHRSRQCNNPAPMRGGKACEGPDQQTEECPISIFEKQNVCINDDDFVIEGDQTPVPPESGCPRPKPPPNSHLRISKRQYDSGEHEEFLCLTGFELEGYQYIHCLPDGTWKPATGKCIKKVCVKPSFPAEMTMSPLKNEYRVGESFGVVCAGHGQSPSGSRYYTCTAGLAWEPQVPEDIQCQEDKPFVPDSRCPRGEKMDGSGKCVCVPREECRSYKDDFCVLDAAADTFSMMSFCGFHSGRCHGDKLFFASDGPCPSDLPSQDWARYRTQVSDRSAVQQACGSDTCYDWETCSSERCECRFPRDCSKEGELAFCVRMLRTQSQRSMSLCATASMKCLKMEIEVLKEGPCDST